MGTATIRGVELVRVGTWHASTGVTQITREDLEAIVTAYGDPEVDRAPIKLGHVDQRFNDGEPALGWVENLRLSDDGRTLVGDLVGMPARLAEIAPTAYRRRSVEIAWGVRTPSGRTYRAVLTGLALLGVSRPAVKGLADVLALYRSAPRAPEAERHAALELVEGLDDARAVAALAAARVEVAALAAARQIPENAVADALDRLDRLAGVPDTARIPHAAITPDNPRGQDDTTEEDGRMPVTEQRVRELLGLEADADVERALQELVAARDANAGGSSGQGGDAGQGDQGAGTAAQGDSGQQQPQQPEVTNATAGQGGLQVVTLSAAAFAELQAQAQAGAQAAAEIARQRRDQIITTALSEGRITPAEQQAWRQALDRDEEGTTALLNALQPRFPVTALGSDAPGQAGAADDAAWDEFTKSLGLGV
ncbi:hypothetical protein LI90_4380 (plasmid) [Carbonactinospora thermoautotrophica]|uniref:Uncharacterized protein n=1 Tax=Carbonactinospora thermoautotrophica TaxID=1469144 RepID=A0A132MHV0_9ACTN|nr:phage protease [Carbonactinospora thermoautotrophica]KWW97408.1 hypothetical protein LI90_4380 [Carbonactinospora thermoautotrophica]